MAVRIDLPACINCGICRRVCPTETIKFFTTHRRTHVVEPSGCIDCNICVPLCPTNCIAHDEMYIHDPGDLDAAKARARAWASKQRRARQAVEQRAAAAIEALAARTRETAHA